MENKETLQDFLAGSGIRTMKEVSEKEGDMIMDGIHFHIQRMVNFDVNYEGIVVENYSDPDGAILFQWYDGVDLHVAVRLWFGFNTHEGEKKFDMIYITINGETAGFRI